MVKGLEKFREHFAEFSDQYVLIGGTGLNFRATKDLDIVLYVQALNREFGERFWDFIKAGGYSNTQRSSGKQLFYRFDKPADKNFPYMLELFSRKGVDQGKDAIRKEKVELETRRLLDSIES